MPRRKYKHLISRVSEVLFREWDPIGVNDLSECSDEYDSYAPVICRLLHEGVDEYRLAAHLDQLMSVNMGLAADEAHNRRIAQRLIELELGEAA